MVVMRDRFSGQRRIAPRWVRLVVVLLMAEAGCNGPGGSGPGDWFKPARQEGERWSIRCLRSGAPNHAALCNRLAELMRNVQGLKPEAVRVQTDATGSTIYYGEYIRSSSSTGGALEFPPAMRRDVDVIRRLMLNQQTPFALAVPEPLDAGQATGRPEWQVARAKGTHTLLVALFYNTPTFDKRKEVAEQYVEQLRHDGYQAYYLHEAVKSFVFVGDFDESDLVTTSQGQLWYGPRVEQMIAGRADDEFRYLTENGFYRKYPSRDGQMVPPPSQLVPVPRGGDSPFWRP